MFLSFSLNDAHPAVIFIFLKFTKNVLKLFNRLLILDSLSVGFKHIDGLKPTDV